MIKTINTAHLFFAMAFIMVMGCSKHMNTTTTGKALVIYPAPPDTARIQFLTSFSSSADIVGKRTGLKRSVLGEEEVLRIGKPYGIATRKGRIFICDATLKGLEVIDLEKKTFTQFVPGGKGQLKLPINCFVDSADMLYITDAGRKEVVVFDDKLNYVTALGKHRSGEDFKPMDVCVSGDHVWVTNADAHKVFVYEKVVKELSRFETSEKIYVSQKASYRFQKTFPDADAGDVNLYNPINICARNGKLYVTDFGDFKIKLFTEDGKYISSVGEYGKSIGQFVRPKGLAVDKDDNLYVVDAGFENVQVFNHEGKLLMFFGGPYNGPGDMWLPAKVHVDYDNLEYYKKWVYPEYELNYLIFVSNQYGPDKINVYGAIKPAAQLSSSTAGGK